MAQGDHSDIEWVIKECKYVEQRLTERLGRREDFKSMIDKVDVPPSVKADMHRMRMARNPVTHVEGVDRLDDRDDFANRAAKVRRYFNDSALRQDATSSANPGSQWLLWVIVFAIAATIIPSLADAAANIVLRMLDALFSIAARLIGATAFIWIPWLLWRLLRKG